MRWSIWNEVESILIKTGVKPILAVVPDNRDEGLMFEPPDASFWPRVRVWQERGWTIGLHGYQHRYVTKEAGMFGRMPISEFAGLAPDVQEAKLRNAIQIFQQQSVFPDLWVAPAHSFDVNTIAALLKVGLRTISDGYGLYPYRDSADITWIPQQVGRFRNIPIGVWTVCHHINDWTSREIVQLDRDLSKFAGQFASMPSLLERYKHRRRSLLDVGTSGLLRLGRRAGSFMRERRRTEAASSTSEKVRETLAVPRKTS